MNAWIALLILGGLVLGWGVLRRARKGGTEKRDEVDAEAPRNVEKGRQHSEAEAAKAAPLSEADAVEVAEHEAFIEKIRTAEHPLVDQFGSDALEAWYLPVALEDAPLYQELGCMPVAPDLDSFTVGWLSVSALEAMVAEAKAEASR